MECLSDNIFSLSVLVISLGISFFLFSHGLAKLRVTQTRRKKDIQRVQEEPIEQYSKVVPRFEDLAENVENFRKMKFSKDLNAASRLFKGNKEV